MNILCIGDIVGKPGRQAVVSLVAGLRKELAIDFVVANAENAANGAGLIPRMVDELFMAGCNVLTMGDHAWDKKEILEEYDANQKVLRPANFPEETPGRGLCLTQTAQGKKIAVINLLGRVFIRYNVNCPFKTFASLWVEAKKHTNIIIVDMHAEATSEKKAIGYFMDGKASVVFGTHTHVQTADETILPQGTAYITDVGMTGPCDSVIGQNKEKIIERFIKSMPSKFEVATDGVMLHGIMASIDEQTGRATKVLRIQRRL
jgi:2',3'-cyclic-nucleotide 2'-phosphodiesterase